MPFTARRLALVIALGVGFASPLSAHPALAHLSQMEGTVTRLHRFAPGIASVGVVLVAGDQIVTAMGRAELTFVDGSVMHLDQHTHVAIAGTARIRLLDGRTVRLAYAGKNGHPFTAPGRIIVGRGHVPLAEMNLDRMTAWLRANPVEAREIMRLNRSYVFFRLAEELDAKDGPIGAAGVPLTPARSLATDRNLWSYGLPFWLEGELPLAGGGSDPLGRILVSQDTGTAIIGPARGDLFFGGGPQAGTRAGLTRQPVRFVVLLPKAEAP